MTVRREHLPRWLTLPEVLGRVGANKREAVQRAILAGEVETRWIERPGVHRELPAWCWSGEEDEYGHHVSIDWEHSTIWFSADEDGGTVEVDRESLDRHFPAPAARAAARGGRPREWDWEGAAIGVVTKIHVEGRPDKLAAVETMLQEWFVVRCDDAPGTTETRKHARKIVEALDAAGDEGR